jgi:hypothetical protein
MDGVQDRCAALANLSRIDSHVLGPPARSKDYCEPEVLQVVFSYF